MVMVKVAMSTSWVFRRVNAIHAVQVRLVILSVYATFNPRGA